MNNSVSMIHTIGIAGIGVVQAPDSIRTVLGSCVGIVLFDCMSKTGGMGHVILPSSADGVGDPAKFADTAVDLLLEEMVKVGAVRGQISAKIAGGARMFGAASATGLGERNVAAVKQRLEKNQVPLLAEDCGGEKGRKITLDPSTGDLTVQIIGMEPTTI